MGGRRAALDALRAEGSPASQVPERLTRARLDEVLDDAVRTAVDDGVHKVAL